MSDLIKRLRSFADWHESLWPEYGIGTVQAAIRDAIEHIEKLETSISKAIGIYSAIEPSNPATAQAVNILKDALKSINEAKA